MKVMRKYVDSGELCIGDFESFRIFLFVEFSAHSQPRLGSGSGNEFDDCAKAAQGFAAPVDADERKSRCSILFHLLVPGGKWHTVIGNLSSSASFCSSTFHRRTR